MRLRCSKCDKTLEVPDSAAGKKVRCPACMTTMVAPPAQATTPTLNPEVDSTPLASVAPQGARSTVHCPGCDRSLAWTPDVAGQVVACPTCRHRLRMPAELPRDSTPPPSLPPTPPTNVSSPGSFSSPASFSSPGGASGAATQPASHAPVAPNPYATPLPAASNNPYQTPIGGTSANAGGHSEPVLYILPGIALAVVAFLTMLGQAAQFGFTLFNGQMDEILILALFLGFPALVNAMIGFAGIQLARRQSLTFCRVMAIVAIVPLFGFCFCGNTPFGIWATVMVFMDNANRDFYS